MSANVKKTRLRRGAHASLDRGAGVILPVAGVVLVSVALTTLFVSGWVIVQVFRWVREEPVRVIIVVALLLLGIAYRLKRRTSAVRQANRG